VTTISANSTQRGFCQAEFYPPSVGVSWPKAFRLSDTRSVADGSVRGDALFDGIQTPVRQVESKSALRGQSRVNLGIAKDYGLAEREGFEPPIRLPVCRISSAVHSTTLPPLQTITKQKNPVSIQNSLTLFAIEFPSPLV
jgi:hypothetical protein